MCIVCVDQLNTLLPLLYGFSFKLMVIAVAYKGQGLPGSVALDFVLSLRDIVCTSSRRKDVGGL